LSKEEEYLQLKKLVDPTDMAESWLKDLETEMKVAVRRIIEGAY
jgi:hypothetical protein